MRFLTTFVALACATFGFSQLANQNAYGAPVDWRTVAEGSNSRILTAGQVVLPHHLAIVLFSNGR